MFFRLISLMTLFAASSLCGYSQSDSNTVGGKQVTDGNTFVSEGDSVFDSLSTTSRNLITPGGVAADGGVKAEYKTEHMPAVEHYVPVTMMLPNPFATNLPSMSFIPGVASIASWGTGGLYATGTTLHMPGLMGVESGSLVLNQQFGNLMLNLYGSAAKYGYFKGLSTTWGFGGDITYRFNENLSLTMFGSYHTSAGIYQPAMMGYLGSISFGGYLNWHFTEHWGVKAGAQTYRRTYDGRWESQPIVMPYYRFSSGAEIGIDVGGILYQVVKGAIDSKHGKHGKQGNHGNHGNHGNPTIRPDIPSLPIAPRR